MLRRIGVLASLAVVAAMFAGVSTASAQQPGDAAVCIFGGLSGTLHNTLNANGIPNAIPDALDGNPLDIERGSYNFHTTNPATCAGVLNGTPTVRQNVAINSDGFFDNIVCGTGFAHDLDGAQTTFVSAPDVAIGGTADPAGYEIPFVAGVGPLLIGPGGKPSVAGLTGGLPGYPQHGADGAGGVSAHGNVVSNYVGTGAVQIIPGNAPPPAQPNENCVEPVGGTELDGDTDEFVVNGFFVAVKVQ